MFFFGLYVRARSLRLSIVRCNTRKAGLFIRYFLAALFKMKSNTHTATRHLYSSLSNPFSLVQFFSLYSILNFLVYSRVDFHP